MASIATSRGRVQIRRLEWPSVALCLTLYTAFAGLTWFSRDLPTLAVLVSCSLLITLHSSLQHEFIHGHPTPWRKLNRALASAPLSVWLPFESYRRSHLVHHCDEALTDPLDDPESYYRTASEWAALGPVWRGVVTAHTTLAGRLVIGPLWNVGRFLQAESRAVLRGDRDRQRIWLRHGCAVGVLMIWVAVICRMNLALYLASVYGGTAILLLRSFAEHRAKEGIFERTAIVENSWFFGPLFLFNNLHAAHHERPLMPWYELPGWYRANRARLLRENGGLVYDSYVEVARRFLFAPHDVVVHPTSVPSPGGREALSSA